MPKPTKIRPPKSHERAWHEGTVKEVRPGVWRAWRERIHAADGKTTRPSRTFKGDDAEQRAKTWAKGDVEPDVLLLGHWLDRWLALRLPIVRPNTRRNYRKYIADCSTLAGRPLAELTTDDWQLLANQLLGRRALSMVRVWKSVVSSAMKAAVPKHIPHNPVTGVKLPKGDERPVRAWKAEEVARMVAAARGYKHETWLWLMFGTGIRIGESRALLRTDVNLLDRTIEVSKSIDDLTGVEGPTKNGKTRTVDLPDEVIPLLQRHMARQAPGQQLLFASPRPGKPLDGKAMRVWLKRVCERAKVRRLPVHSTRHTFATLSLEAGVPLKEVSEALGHSNVAITASIYSHAIEQRRRRAAAAMGAVLQQRVPTPIRAIGTQNGTPGDA